MAASTPGGSEVADESEMRAKLSEELGDAIGFLEVHNKFFKNCYGIIFSYSITGQMVKHGEVGIKCQDFLSL